MSTMTFLEALKTETAMLQAEHPTLAEAIGRASALITDGKLFVEESGREAMALSSDATQWYSINGSCSCKAQAFRHEPCKHRLGLRLYQKVVGRVADTQRHTRPPAPTLPPEAFTTIQGKPFVRFAGLLQLAHERGLVELTTTMVMVTADMAVCQAVAKFNDGHVFTDIGDASPTNVAKHLAPHFVRMAATRASARALRRALNISAVAVEELGDEAAA